MQQGYYRAALMYSPVAWSQGELDFRSSQQTLADLNYSLSQPGQFWAVSLEYYFPFPPPVMLSMWFNGSLVNIEESLDLEFYDPRAGRLPTRMCSARPRNTLLEAGSRSDLVF